MYTKKEVSDIFYREVLAMIPIDKNRITVNTLKSNDTCFVDYGIGSIDYAVLISNLSQIFSINLDLNKMVNICSIANAYQYIIDQIGCD